MGVRYGGVENIVTRYRAYRTGEGGVAESDDAGALLSVYAAIGGVEAFAETVGNHQRTSTRAGVLKAQAVLDAANLLVRLNTTSTSLLREASDLRRLRPGGGHCQASVQASRGTTCSCSSGRRTSRPTA